MGIHVVAIGGVPPSAIQPSGEAVVSKAGVVMRLRLAVAAWVLAGTLNPGDMGAGLS